MEERNLNNHITICEARTQAGVRRFWAELGAYHARDILPRDEDREDLIYFLGEEYRSQIEALRERERDRLHFLFFRRGEEEIGFAMPVIYDSEDGKCFLLEFCVYPQFRGNGTGRACAAALLVWARERGMAYAELNYGGDPRRLRFWQRLGFRPNGADEWGEPLLLLPPEEDVPLRAERLTEPDWQLFRLENSFRRAVGEEPLTEEEKNTLSAAVQAGRIAFFTVKRRTRCVGLCSVSACFSTFACGQAGSFEDFYIEPCFRGKGGARLLVAAANAWCRETGIASLTVTCAPCDEGLYQALGFGTPLGRTFAHLAER